MKDVRPNLHSGIGFGFDAWKVGLRWYTMRRTSVDTGRYGPAIYDESLFHLKGAVRLAETGSKDVPAPVRGLGSRRFEAVIGLLRGLVPAGMRRRLIERFPRTVSRLVEQPRDRWESEAMTDALTELLADPDPFIESLRQKRPLRLVSPASGLPAAMTWR